MVLKVKSWRQKGGGGQDKPALQLEEEEVE